ncbi:MAG: ParA family protein [Magnetococcales bacterium]|nr:ParA family protein [Magnetococcales bacterium]
MKTYAIYNIKGGVGKTTISVNLAFLSALDGKRTLIWDLDPQGGTSYYLNVRPKIKGGVDKFVRTKSDIENLLRMTGYPNLDILPSDISYRRMDHLIRKTADKKPIRMLETRVKPLRKNYDHLILDCPPDLSMVAENVFRMADVLVVPLIPTTLSLRAYNRLVRFLVKNKINKSLRVLPFFNQVNENKPIHRVVTRNVRDKHPIFLNTAVPESNVIEAMGVKRAPVFSYARESAESNTLKDLWQEIKERSKD